MTLADQTPAQIDAAIVATTVQFQREASRADRLAATYKRTQTAYHDTPTPYDSLDALTEMRAEATAAAEAAERTRQALRALEAEFTRRGGWDRYWLVTNTGGHVHRSTTCTTCFPTTPFALLFEHSGMARADLVELAGAAACTACFPWAPIGTLRRATRLETPAARAARVAREEQRAARAAAKAAASLPGEDGNPIADQSGGPLKTERAATNARSAALVSLAHYQFEHPRAAQWRRIVREVNAAVAAKHQRPLADVEAEAMRKAAASYRRQFGGAMPGVRIER